jgi:predicted AlkP superfamily phosphohydrolase/phosphomutase
VVSDLVPASLIGLIIFIVVFSYSVGLAITHMIVLFDYNENKIYSYYHFITLSWKQFIKFYSISPRKYNLTSNITSRYTPKPSDDGIFIYFKTSLDYIFYWKFKFKKNILGVQDKDMEKYLEYVKKDIEELSREANNQINRAVFDQEEILQRMKRGK